MLIRITPLIILSIFFNLLEGSVVMDAYSQKGIHIEDYCPRMENCLEGSHVMCMYYDPNRVMGEHCSNPMNITMTPDLATKLLDVINARAEMRKKLYSFRTTIYENYLEFQKHEM